MQHTASYLFYDDHFLWGSDSEEYLLSKKYLYIWLNTTKNTENEYLILEDGIISTQFLPSFHFYY